VFVNSKFNSNHRTSFAQHCQVCTLVHYTAKKYHQHLIPTLVIKVLKILTLISKLACLQCFDTVDLGSRRASGP